MTWGTDPTDPMPTPQQVGQYHVHHCPERRGEGVAVALIVLLTFIIGVSAVLSAMLSLGDTIDRLLTVPMCQEVPE